MMGKMLSLVLCATVLAGCGAKSEGVDRRWATDKKSVAPETGIDAMNDVDRFFYAHSFTTIASVPYGRCWPESLRFFRLEWRFDPTGVSSGSPFRRGGSSRTRAMRNGCELRLLSSSTRLVASFP